jgi:hypothetical protein
MGSHHLESSSSLKLQHDFLASSDSKSCLNSVQTDGRIPLMGNQSIFTGQPRTVKKKADKHTRIHWPGFKFVITVFSYL